MQFPKVLVNWLLEAKDASILGASIETVFNG
jgi:hypothetical protein